MSKKLSGSALHWIADIVILGLATYLQFKGQLTWQMFSILALVFGAISIGKIQSIRAGMSGIEIDGKIDHQKTADDIIQGMDLQNDRFKDLTGGKK